MNLYVAFLFASFGQTSQLILHCLLAGGIFFAMAGLRELNCRELQGCLFLATSLFFAALHLVYLNNLSPTVLASLGMSQIDLWQWLTQILAPVIIALFLIYGMIRMVHSVRAGMIKLFFGLTLFCYLYMVGANWPIDVKGILAIVYTGFFFDVSLKSAV